MPDETTTEESTPPEESKPNVEKGDQAPSMLKQYQEETNQRKELLKQETILQERKEKFHVEQMLGGSSEAGQAPPVKKELTDEEYKDKILAGEKPGEE